MRSCCSTSSPRTRTLCAAAPSPPLASSRSQSLRCRRLSRRRLRTQPPASSPRWWSGCTTRRPSSARGRLRRSRISASRARCRRTASALSRASASRGWPTRTRTCGARRCSCTPGCSSSTRSARRSAARRWSSGARHSARRCPPAGGCPPTSRPPSPPSRPPRRARRCPTRQRRRARRRRARRRRRRRRRARRRRRRRLPRTPSPPRTSLPSRCRPRLPSGRWRSCCSTRRSACTSSSPRGWAT
mmetsp:Transcript_22268/g.69759  ORF Transcript_22268/g.69759 Transcript_22268/m.69759 type:complete len:244 (+) Transcript_22268:969-1700(+)